MNGGQGCLDAHARASEAQGEPKPIVNDQVAEVIAYDCAVADSSESTSRNSDVVQQQQEEGVDEGGEDAERLGRRQMVRGLLEEQPCLDFVAPDYQRHRNVVSRVLDDALLAAVRSRPVDERQVVLLGHGMDTRYEHGSSTLCLQLDRTCTRVLGRLTIGMVFSVSDTMWYAYICVSVWMQAFPHCLAGGYSHLRGLAKAELGLCEGYLARQRWRNHLPPKRCCSPTDTAQPLEAYR